MKYNILQELSENLAISNFFNTGHPYQYHAKTKDNSRASLFQEKASDVVQNGDQGFIFYKAEKVHFRGPFQGYWVTENL